MRLLQHHRTLFLLLLLSVTTWGWEWSDLMTVGWAKSKTLSLDEISDMRQREIKRRLTRKHGYSAEEVGRMIDKKELIEELAFAEEKIRLQQDSDNKRQLTIQGVCVALLSVLIALLWPLIRRAIDVAHVNFVVYMDKKSHQWKRCSELRSVAALMGVFIMGVLDCLQLWLTASVLLSWVMRSKYFFPVPNIPFRPAEMMGGDIANSAAAGYGINVGSMAVTWAMRFIYDVIEVWTGKAMVKAHNRRRELEKAKRKAERKAERRRARREAASAPPKELPTEWVEPKETGKEDDEEDSDDGFESKLEELD